MPDNNEQANQETPSIPYRLRQLAKLPRGAYVRGRNEQPCLIQVRLPKTREVRQIFKVFKFIDRQLTSEDYRLPIRVAMNLAVFLITKSPEVGAYTAQQVVILNAGLIDCIDFEEFAVTIAHELLHIVEAKEDGMDLSAHSESEARHDLMVYALLGVGIPRSHWAFRKFPHLLQEIQEP